MSGPRRTRSEERGYALSPQKSRCSFAKAAIGSPARNGIHDRARRAGYSAARWRFRADYGPSAPSSGGRTDQMDRSSPVVRRKMTYSVSGW